MYDKDQLLHLNRLSLKQVATHRKIVLVSPSYGAPTLV